MTAFSNVPASWAAAAVTSTALAFAPRSLVHEVSGRYPSRRGEIGLLAVLVSLAVLSAAMPTSSSAAQSAINATVISCAAATVYYDARYLIIPDIVHVLLIGVALFHSTTLGWIEALGGGALCAVLLGAVALGYQRHSGSEGLGWADVKLAGVFGLLLGPETGLWMVCGAAISGSIYGLWRQRGMNQPGDQPLIPFGAFLAFAGAGLFLCRA
jgi:prepilin signal peptidase PulO-like enzyme (type II secretory pathway)